MKSKAIKWLSAQVQPTTTKAELDVIDFLKKLVRDYKAPEKNTEKEKTAQEICELLNDKGKRQELEALTPSMLQNSGESKFRHCFELLYPIFLPRLREKVPSITRREELLSMLIILKQDNKEIAELLTIAPRSVLMIRHRLRQKIGMNTEHSLEYFLEDIISGSSEQQNEE